MDRLRIFSPGTTRQDSEYALWKGEDPNIFVQQQIPVRPGIASGETSSDTTAAQLRGTPIVSHEVMIEHLTRSA